MNIKFRVTGDAYQGLLYESNQQAYIYMIFANPLFLLFTWIGKELLTHSARTCPLLTHNSTFSLNYKFRRSYDETYYSCMLANEVLLTYIEGWEYEFW